MKTLATLVTLVGCLLPALALAGQERKPYPTMGKIIRLDPRFDELVPKDAAIEKLAAGFKWSEGPVWIKDGGYLLFSDIPRKRINKWKEGEGISVFLEPSGYTGSKPRGGEPGSNGLLLDAKGRLVLCEHGDRRVSRLEKNGKKSVLADKYMGKRLNSPNDACFHSNGDLYFTDPPYGLEKVWDDPARELDFCGVYRVSAKSKKITLLTKEMSRPNGIAFSPDQKTLYVANSDPEKAIWKAFPVMKDGTLGEGRVFFDATAMSRKKKGLPDGLRVDHQGHIFATGPGGVLVFSPKGEHLGSIETGVATANCGWGNDGSTLYITADSNLCRIKLSTKGKGF
ncbi:MAG: SMP-30/gluconolactonase/LRE family protein [Planctomycetes bacterium]|nr:SMP-30/gluconolactonase/LRE family protein [Planctomycetota bacterium]